jgi:hypothetical protein
VIFVAHKFPSLLVGAAFAATACGSGSSSELSEQGLVQSPPAPPAADLARAARDADELGRALASPHHRTAARLGAHEFRGTSSVTIRRDGKEVEALTDTTSIRFGAGGEFAAELRNSRDYGRDAIWVGAALYLRPRYGKYHQRAANDDREPGQICDQIYATLGDYFDLVRHGVQPKDGGPVDKNGRKARRITVSAAAKPRRRREAASQRKWREQAAVQSVSGDFVFDQETGAVLEGKLSGAVTYQREGALYEMTVEVTHAVTDVGGAITIAAPPAEQTVTTFEPPSELQDRATLLKDIAPPARTAPTPQSSGQASGPSSGEGGKGGTP